MGFTMEIIKQIPYGVADFESVMGRNFYYVAKPLHQNEDRDSESGSPLPRHAVAQDNHSANVKITNL